MSLGFFTRAWTARPPWGAGLLHALVLLPLPFLAFVTLAPGGLPAFGHQLLPPAPPAPYASQGPFLIADISEFPRHDKYLRLLQDNPPPMPSELYPGDSGVAALLNGWERVDRTATRHKLTLDYFLGFGF